MVAGLLDKQRWINLFDNSSLFLDGMLMTLKVSVLGFTVALILGIILGLMSTTKSKLLKGISRVYVELFQNTKTHKIAGLEHV